jgi:hypothetical protein
VLGSDEKTGVGLRLAVGTEDLGVVEQGIGSRRALGILVEPANNQALCLAVGSFCGDGM